jgi:NhaA family Na+:H+ antiporter
MLNNSITLGIIFGLVLGKPLGIMLFSWIAVKMDIAQLPSQVDWKSMFAVSWLAGIGFTMSIFIAGIAYTDPVLVDESKIGILIASTLASVIGLSLGFSLTRAIGDKKSSA